MCKVDTVENLSEALALRYNTMDMFEASTVLDELLEVKEDLMKNKGANTGVTHYPMSLHVKAGEELPKVHDFHFVEPMMGEPYFIKVMEIIKMEWITDLVNGKIAVVVEVLAKRIKTKK